MTAAGCIRYLTFAGAPVDPQFVVECAHALADLRKRYPDYDQHSNAMDAIAAAITPNFGLIGPREYLTILYLAAKNGAEVAAAPHSARVLQPATASGQPENRATSGAPLEVWDSPAAREAALAQVYAEAGKRHPDFDLFQPVMLRVAEAFHPQWDRILLSEFVEGLYCIAKYAGFLAQLRDEILLKEAVPASSRKM